MDFERIMQYLFILQSRNWRKFLRWSIDGRIPNQPTQDTQAKYNSCSLCCKYSILTAQIDHIFIVLVLFAQAVIFNCTHFIHKFACKKMENDVPIKIACEIYSLVPFFVGLRKTPKNIYLEKFLECCRHTVQHAPGFGSGPNWDSILSMLNCGALGFATIVFNVVCGTIIMKAVKNRWGFISDLYGVRESSEQCPQRFDKCRYNCFAPWLFRYDGITWL